MVEFKLDLCQIVAVFASAVLLDPECGAAQTIAASACGFLAGRALWQEDAQIRWREARMNFLRDTAPARLRELTEVVDSYGKPWYLKLGGRDGGFAPLTEGWY